MTVVADVWTEERLRALGVRTDLVTAGRVMGIARHKVRAMYRDGTLPFPTLQCGRTVVVPVRALLSLLCLDEEPPEAAAKNRTP